MKGITPIIAIIILLLITVALAGAGWSYINMYTGGLTNNVVEVTSATCANGVANVIMRNSGTGTMDTAQIRVMNSTSGMDITPAVTWSSSIGDTGKVLEMRFDQAGSPTKDTSGNGNDGTVSGATWTAAGKVGGVYSFDGVNDYVNVGNPSAFSSGMSGTVSAWIKSVGNNQFQYIFDKSAGGSSGTIHLALTYYGLETRVGFYVGNSGGYSSVSQYSVTQNTWYHFAGTWNTTHICLYKDGTGSCQVIAYPFYNGINNLTIGASSSNVNSMNGLIDEARIWNRALSADEVKALYSNSVAVQPGGMASFTHTCGSGRCTYNIISGGRTQQAYAQC